MQKIIILDQLRVRFRVSSLCLEFSQIKTLLWAKKLLIRTEILWKMWLKMKEFEIFVVIGCIALHMTSSAFAYHKHRFDLKGPYCASIKKHGQPKCCDSRDDNCSVQILGTWNLRAFVGVSAKKWFF